MVEDEANRVAGNSSGEAINGIGENRYWSLGVWLLLVKGCCEMGSDWDWNTLVMLRVNI